jgi:hypothetical protein
MASDGADNLRQESWPSVNPWHLVLAGLAASVLALFLCLVQNWVPGEGPARFFVPLRGLVITVGVILAGGAVSVRLRTASWEFEERVVSAALTGIAAFTVLLGWLALDRAWDSIALFLGVVAFVGFAGCGLILLPRNWRRGAAVGLVILHFCGILSAVTSAPPPGSVPPWITQVVWTRLSRPYLQFMYLNNAYHFYSPEPGPACQLWFYIKFEDDTGEWLKIPKREDYATRQEYQRILSVTENANQMFPQPPPTLALMYANRFAAGNLYYPPIKVAPWDPQTSDGTPPAFQYREPNMISKKTIESYARHVGMTYHSDAHPDVPVKSVKIYRVVHMIVAPEQLAHDLDSDDPTNFTPYFQGEFDREGNMISKLDDPFLYWLIPILREPKESRKPAAAKPNQPAAWNPDDLEIVDYCKLHAEGAAIKER